MDPLNIVLVIFSLAIGLSALAFWIWMLVDCLKNESRQGNDKIVWLIVIIATKLLGAVIYYYVRRPERLRLEAG